MLIIIANEDKSISKNTFCGVVVRESLKTMNKHAGVCTRLENINAH